MQWQVEFIVWYFLTFMPRMLKIRKLFYCVCTRLCSLYPINTQLKLHLLFGSLGPLHQSNCESWPVNVTLNLLSHKFSFESHKRDTEACVEGRKRILETVTAAAWRPYGLDPTLIGLLVTETDCE